MRNGELYLFSGSYSYFTTGSNGCDSVAYLDLVVGHPNNSWIIADACGEFAWNGELYSETGLFFCDYKFYGVIQYAL